MELFRYRPPLRDHSLVAARWLAVFCAVQAWPAKYCISSRCVYRPRHVIDRVMLRLCADRCHFDTTSFFVLHFMRDSFYIAKLDEASIQLFIVLL